MHSCFNKTGLCWPTFSVCVSSTLNLLFSRTWEASLAENLRHLDFEFFGLIQVSNLPCSLLLLLLVKCSASQLLLHRGGGENFDHWPVPVHTRLFFVLKGFSCTFEQWQ
jgi:hypothetical protein